MVPRENGRRWLGLAAILAVAGVLAVAYTGLYRSFSTPDRHTVRATFADTGRLSAGDPVRIDGVNVGEVTTVRPGDGGSDPLVVMSVDESAGPVFADAAAAIKWRTLLGGSFVIELERGTASAGPLGSAAIPPARTSTQAEFEDFIAFAQGRARAGMQTMPGELARAFRDPQPFARLMTALDDVAPPVARGMRAMRGRGPRGDLRTVVAAGARTVRALDTPTDDIRHLVGGAAATFEVTAARRADLQALFAEAPGVMRRARTTLARLDTSLGLLDPLIARLRRSAPRLSPSLRALTPTVVEADRLLDRSRPLFRALSPAVVSLERAARSSVPTLDGLAPGLERIDTTVLPYMAEIDPQNQRSAAQMVGPAFSVVGGGATGNFDGNGHFLRFPSASGPNSLQTVPCQPLLTNPDAGELAACDSLQQALEDYFSYNPLAPARDTAPPAEGARR